MVDFTSVHNCRSSKDELTENLMLIHHGTHSIPKHRSILPFIYEARRFTHQQQGRLRSGSCSIFFLHLRTRNVLSKGLSCLTWEENWDRLRWPEDFPSKLFWWGARWKRTNRRSHFQSCCSRFDELITQSGQILQVTNNQRLMRYFYCLIINILDIFRVFSDLWSACQATAIDSISMNFYIEGPVTRLPMFNF